MNKYIKPTFMLASLGVTALAGSNCSMQQEDRDYIMGLLERFEIDVNAAFVEAENCEEKLDGLVLEGYCKFTSGSNNPTQVFFS